MSKEPGENEEREPEEAGEESEGIEQPGEVEEQPEEAGAGSLTEEATPTGTIYTFSFPKGKEVRYVFLSLAQLLNEGLFTMGPDGITLKAIDPSKVALISLNIPSTALEEVNITETVKVGLIFDTVKKLAKRIRAKDKVELGIDKGRGRFIMTIYYGAKGKESGMYRRFYLPIVDVSQEEVPELNIEYPTRVRMSIDQFYDALLAASEISDAVTISIDPSAFSVRAIGDGGRYYEVQFQSSDEVFQEYAASEKHEATYSLDYLLDMSRQMKPICEYVTIELASNKPIKLTYEFASGYLTYFVAPRAA